MMNITPSIEKNTNVMAPLAAEKRGFLKNRRSSIGWSMCSSHQPNPNNTAALTAKPISDVELAQPWLGASMMEYSSATKPPTDNSDPTTSSRGAWGSLERGNTIWPAITTTTTTGMLTRNTDPHQK